MAGTAIIRRLRGTRSSSPGMLLNALPFPVMEVDRHRVIQAVNLAAQQFFETSEVGLVGRPLTDHVAEDSPVVAMTDMVLARGYSLSDHGVSVEGPRIGRHSVTLTVAPLAETQERAVVMLQPSSIAQQIENQLTHRGAARSVSAMAAMLAHEVKNPLSGIRGAAQLLEQTASDEDRSLTRLICDEADRIVSLVNRMEVFSDTTPPERAPVNIHTVLERVKKLAQTGFARHLRLVERYDPSLPAVFGNHDQLVQIFLNLVKNAAEAAPEDGGEIVLGTAFQRGVSIVAPGSSARTFLPIAVTVQDNGPGIPDDLRPHLFDPFVTTKKKGSGLGLALVAKIIDDHGGVIGFDSEPGRTVFRVSLPIAGERPGAGPAAEAEAS